MTNDIPNWTDSFGRQLAFGSVNLADLPAYHRYSPIRYRITRNQFDGNGYQRVNPEYGEGTGFYDDNVEGNEDVHFISPNQGEAVQFKTAQRYEYVVGYDGLPSFAFAISRELQPGDRLALGFDTTYPPRSVTDGYFAEQRGDTDPKEIELFERRDGNEIGERNVQPIKRPLTYFQRWELQYNWYNVGEESWRETYTTHKDGQINEPIGRTEVTKGDANAGVGGRGPLSGTGRIFIELERGADTDPIDLHAGSIAYIILGDDQQAYESKWHREENVTHDSLGDYEPILAIRKDQTRPSTSVQFSYVVQQSGPGGDLLTMSYPKDLILDSNGDPIENSTTWDNPPEHGVSEASAIETTRDVGQSPDNNGNLVTNTANPGGFQLAAAYSDRKSSEGGGLVADESRNLVDGDYAVVLAKPEGNEDYNLEIAVRETQ